MAHLPTGQSFVGCFHDELSAAKGYDIAAEGIFGQHAKLNFPTGTAPDDMQQPEQRLESASNSADSGSCGMVLLAPNKPKKQKTEKATQGGDGSISRAGSTVTMPIAASSVLAVSYLGVEFHPASGRWIVPAGGRFREPLKNTSSGGG